MGELPLARRATFRGGGLDLDRLSRYCLLVQLAWGAFVEKSAAAVEPLFLKVRRFRIRCTSALNWQYFNLQAEDLDPASMHM
jgi:hypothetical protein